MDMDTAPRHARLAELRRLYRREGSLAAALVQSLALAVIGTAGAYPSWVLVKGGERDIVLGASWAATGIDPDPDSPLLGSAGGPIMNTIAFCCLLSVGTGSLALTLDFLGLRQGRGWAPLLHGVTAVLIASSAACGSCLLALVRGLVRSDPDLVPLGYSTSAGQSLFLSFLACVLAAAATGFSCASPARVQPARSSWDLTHTAARAARRPRAREEERGEEQSTASLQSAMWQERRLSSFLLDAALTQEPDPRQLRWYDYNQVPGALGSLHNLLRSTFRGQPEEYSLTSWASSLSMESRFQLPAPAPSTSQTQLPLHEAPAAAAAAAAPTPPGRHWLQEDAPGESPRRGESLTWGDAVARAAQAGPEPGPEIGLAGMRGRLPPEDQEDARI